VGKLVEFGSDQPGAEFDAEALGIELGLVHTAVIEGQLGGGNAQLDRPRHDEQALALALLDVIAGIERTDFAGDSDGQRGRVERLDGRNAAAAGLERLPEGGVVLADGAEDADAGEYRATRRGSHDAPKGPNVESRIAKKRSRARLAGRVDRTSYLRATRR